ncbi:small ribosomal subunit protein uS2m-like [Tubulanus polymorphus]|uniref:small ribosomal subunit protein uS2m-like n=1 Tax=Tubulanus polymorphus TaxID=672921 RepID=UPI003DA6B0CB
MHKLMRSRACISKSWFRKLTIESSTAVGVGKTVPSSAADGLVSETAENMRLDKAVVNPLAHEDFFEVQKLVTLNDLFACKVHLGHKYGTRNPYMLPYIYGNRQDVDIIDLDQTLSLLRDALNFAAHVAFRDGIILFLGRNRQMMPLIEKTAQECGEYAHCRYWSGGTFTNSTNQFGAITRLPDLCVFLSTLTSVFQPHSGIVSAAKLNIPSIAVLDSNCDPRYVTYPVPGNDDTPVAVELYCRLFKEVILRAKAKRKELLELGYDL